MSIHTLHLLHTRFLDGRPSPQHAHTIRKSLVFGILLFSLTIPIPISHLAAQHLSFNDALSQAMKSHPDIRAALAKKDIFRGQKLQAISPAPLTIGYYEEDMPNGFGLGSGGQRMYSITQEFDVPLLIGARGRLYSALEASAEAEIDYTKRTIKAEVVSAYAESFSRNRQMLLHERNAALAKQTATAAQAKFNAGEITRLEFLQAESRAVLARQELTAAKNAYTAAILRLAAATGLPLSQENISFDSLRTPAIAERSVAPEEQFMDRHPLLQRAAHIRDGYNRDHGWRWMEYLPSFSVSAFRQEYTDFGNFWGAEFTASVPLWLFLAPRGAAKESYGYSVEAEAQYQSARREVLRRVQSARDMYNAAQETMHAYSTTLLSESAEMLRTAEQQYQEGEISFLEYSAATASANTILLGYYDALTSLYSAAAALEMETGTEIQWYIQ